MFTAYGRLDCYYTTTGETLIAGSSAYECGYSFPLPRCDSDKNGTADREHTAAEVQALVDRGTITVGRPFTIAANGRCVPAAPPPSQAGFSDDACVTARLRMYENRSSGSNAEPGVLSSDRTLISGQAWDLDITSPHPATASPPRGTGDPSGCADGQETRADHGTRTAPSDVSLPAGSGHRKNANAADATTSAAVVLPKSSAAVNSQPPPGHTASEFAAIRENLAHRYASKIAEHTCAVKKKEAEATLLSADSVSTSASFDGSLP